MYMSNENPSPESKDPQPRSPSGGRRAPSSGSRPKQTIEVVERTWRAEAETAQTYRDLAERERVVPAVLRMGGIKEEAQARAGSARVPPGGARTALDRGLRRQGWGGGGGRWVEDAVYGANDGSGQLFEIVAGVGGATNNQR